MKTNSQPWKKKISTNITTFDCRRKLQTKSFTIWREADLQYNCQDEHDLPQAVSHNLTELADKSKLTAKRLYK